MALSLFHEDPKTLPEIAKTLPSRPATSTIWRWCTHGAKGVRLEHIRAGRKVMTSTAAVERFFTATAQAALETLDARHATAPAPKPAPRRRSKRREKEIAAAYAVVRGDGKSV